MAVSWPGDASPSPRGVASENEPPDRGQQREQSEQGQGPGVRRDQIDPARVPRRGLVVLRGHQEIGRQRHDLPGEQEHHAILSDDDQGHPRGQQAVEEAQLAAVVRMLALLPVTQAVHAAQQRDQEDGDEEEGGEPVDGDGEVGPRHTVPGDGDGSGVSVYPHQGCAGESGGTRCRAEERGQPLAGLGVSSEEESRQAAQGRHANAPEHQLARRIHASALPFRHRRRGRRPRCARPPAAPRPPSLAAGPLP